ncbi:ATP-binding protein [Streptomyces murinus]|uniref:Anti-sigma regulatory factor (Ser/Thr protein kinase) n=1 Tax=Streptomyces murinus TaxID=33900 RepID=A0A7W3RLV9_STRMR|nr:ATP-binding protein [Streptomyces murinus]MBA9054450.1 anti-sigma regulatory factor (Ser/Thr protein kinase) [Streptomyces murinus]
MPTHRRSFPGDPKELYAARRWTRAMLDGHPRCEDAALIVTELGTNAVVHTASGNSDGAFHVALTVSPLAVVIEVTDSGTSETSPRVQRPTPDSTHGRGLGMVAALADRVRVQGSDPGRTVTAELDAPLHRQEPTPRPACAEGLLP